MNTTEAAQVLGSKAAEVAKVSKVKAGHKVQTVGSATSVLIDVDGKVWLWDTPETGGLNPDLSPLDPHPTSPLAKRLAGDTSGDNDDD